MIHPDDENGHALRRLEADGDDLSRARDIDFSVVFHSEGAAEKFAEHFRNLGLKVDVSFAQVKADHPWDAVVVKSMVPTHSAITEFERELQEIANVSGGYNDGWGCFAQPGKHLQ
ncbi:ribonuclease E inhibitor RraB [Acidicapsa dinghuensis]|uniref:Ribonuclease E inhibitor RraB n=1 Tax=Acidicapsa dinghuensis TaxID=2218256 RepID=A0ABW1EAY1_9BACT|nr:ribonuclease E inhibitor RraB [Acidicapsa dinghuensis]